MALGSPNTSSTPQPSKTCTPQSLAPNLSNKEFVESLFPEFNGDVHSYYTCSPNCKISPLDTIFYEKNKKKKRFQHNWLYLPNYAFDATTDVWWLIHKENVGMYCLLCRKHKGKSKTNKDNTIWNEKPCVKFLGDAIRDHLKSGKHKKAIEREKLQRVSSFEQEIQHKENVRYEVVRNVFSAMYWLAKEEMPCKKLITMLELVQRMGLTDMSYFNYFNHRSYPSVFISRISCEGCHSKTSNKCKLSILWYTSG